MFFGCRSIKSLDLSNFYTPSLKIMNHLFNGCSSLISLDISNFNTSSVNNMNYVFKECSSLTSLDLTKFDTSSIKSMQGIFQSCSSLTSLDLSSYDTSSFTSMFNMFLNCISLELLNLSNFYISDTTNVKDMFKNCTSLRVVDLTNFFSEKSTDIFEGFDSLVIINRTTENNKENDESKLTQEVDGDGINYYEELSSVYIHDIINNLDDLIRDKDQKETHIMNGIDYTVIIKPINDYVEESTVHVDLSECERILKQRDSSKNFSILQINLKNKNKRSLVDQVEYKIYDNEQNEVDLSVCESTAIKIQYKITNSSLINLEQIKYFNEKGIDIFNINDTFFNDICYPYSDNNSNSDMILSDRVSDIYQNLSICGKECEYNSFNTDKQAVNCNCKIKKEVSSEEEEDNLVNYIEYTFLDSNFGVIKCYSLVFGIENKLKNIGFWIFGILTIAHIPIYAFYFINGINPVKKFIRSEMSNKGYMPKNIYTYKHPRESIKKVVNFNVSHRENTNTNNPPNKKSNNNNIINNAPPKKVIKIKIKKKKKVLKNVIENEDKMNDQNLNNDILIIEEEDKDENIDGRKLSKKKTFNFSSRKNNLISRTDLDELITNVDDKNNKKFSRKSLNITSITASQNYSEKNTERNMKTEEIKSKKNENDYPLILINANNVENYELLKSNLILNNYNYDEAIKYDNRSFIRILFIFLISKDNLLNIIFFNPPLELRPLRICIFIFNYACDLALNALFYLSKNISDKYHYTGSNKIVFSLINNITKSLTSSIVSYILLYFFQSLTQSSNTIVKLFRNQENLLKKDKKYKVEEDTKRKIESDIRKILKCLKIKIICFIVFESIFMLFFFYYVTAFCQVYLSTQTSWLLDSLTSYLISFLISLVISLVLTILYKISLYNQIKILYIISMFIYS
jgi:surface protein